MNIESLFLRGLFGASVLVCGLTLAAMVTASPASAGITTNHTVAAATVALSAADAGNAG
ncbi:MAG TPA: hypothetical protein VMA74_18990 [Dyella sp.]|uniref:hypothetical protein n=1 Tax=Dyella sp. TaxID=1869338 RepID=UPI002BE5599E|nr:hypothetical protein [Dyella sp.]HUB91814.1 hypothetical protein [Dyella sp.]